MLNRVGSFTRYQLPCWKWTILHSKSAQHTVRTISNSHCNISSTVRKWALKTLQISQDKLLIQISVVKTCTPYFSWKKNFSEFSFLRRIILWWNTRQILNFNPGVCKIQEKIIITYRFVTGNIIIKNIIFLEKW